jgi:hypothetical protein
VTGSSPQVERVTESDANDQLLYFTSTSVLAGDAGIVFISDRTGHPNVFHLDVASGETRQLTRNGEGVLQAYVYFSGTPQRGFGKASVSLDPVRGIAYFVQGREVCAVDLEGDVRVLAEIPNDETTAFTHVSADGRRLCVPTSDARTLAGAAPTGARDGRPRPGFYDEQDPPYDVDARVQVEGLSSYLRVYDTASGDELETVAVPRAWITHVQFSPDDASLILYNHEYCSQAGVRRMWLWDGERHRALRDESGAADASDGAHRSRDDWLCHEMWERDGGHVVYHGGHGRDYNDPPCFLGRVDARGGRRREIALPDGWDQYGHFSVGPSGRLVSDGYYRTAESAGGWAGEWIAIADVDWDAGLVEWRPLARHGSSWSSQDAHPHPIFDHAGRFVYFTSDRDGKRAVYRVEVGA